MKVVLDTNVLLVSVSDRSKHHWLYQALLKHEFQLYVTNAILNEYEEKLAWHWKPAVAQTVIRTLLELPNVHAAAVYFQMNLIVNDPDDDKFVDCAFASGCDYLVTNDRDFNILKKLDFPIINVVSLEEFKLLFLESIQ